MKYRIDLRNVSKVYSISNDRHPISLSEALFKGSNPAGKEDIAAVSDVTITIEEGERVGVVGHNGAGKSTLLQIIAGLIEPSSGTVLISGNVSAIMTMGMSLRLEATGRENIFLDGELSGRTEAESEALVDGIIEFTELEEFFDMPVRTYSSGMRARLAFSLAVSVEPEILIIDEVLSVGDAKFNVKAQKRITELTDAGKIVIVVSHGLAGLRDTCSRCLWLDDGKLVMDGEPELVTVAYEESVARADERDLARQFESKRPNSPVDSESAITKCVLESPDGSPCGTRIESECDYDLVIVGQHSLGEGARVEVSMERLDGLPYWSKQLLINSNSGASGEFEVRCKMRPMTFAAGVYRVDASLYIGNQFVAQGGSAFEVTTRRLLIGGTPLLYYPSTVATLSEEPGMNKEL